MRPSLTYLISLELAPASPAFSQALKFLLMVKERILRSCIGVMEVKSAQNNGARQRFPILSETIIRNLSSHRLLCQFYMSTFFDGRYPVVQGSILVLSFLVATVMNRVNRVLVRDADTQPGYPQSLATYWSYQIPMPSILYCSLNLCFFREMSYIKTHTILSHSIRK